MNRVWAKDKPCSRCGLRPRSHQTWCRECQADYQKQYALTHPHRRSKVVRTPEQEAVWKAHRSSLPSSSPEYTKDKRYRRNHGISLEDVRAMLASQNGGCAICGDLVEIGAGGQGYRAANLDHDHATGAIREILCGPCNAGLGHFKDKPHLLRLAADYLEKHGSSYQDPSTDSD